MLHYHINSCSSTTCINATTSRDSFMFTDSVVVLLHDLRCWHHLIMVNVDEHQSTDAHSTQHEHTTTLQHTRHWNQGHGTAPTVHNTTRHQQHDPLHWALLARFAPKAHSAWRWAQRRALCLLAPPRPKRSGSPDCGSHPGSLTRVATLPTCRPPRGSARHVSCQVPLDAHVPRTLPLSRCLRSHGPSIGYPAGGPYAPLRMHSAVRAISPAGDSRRVSAAKPYFWAAGPDNTEPRFASC